MATLNFTVDEALNVLNANVRLPESIKDIRANRDGLLVTVSGNIDILVRQESFRGGVLKLAISSDSWAFKLAASLGKVDQMLDNAIRSLPFVRREGMALFIDLDRALGTKFKGFRVKDFQMRESSLRIEF
jgi:hypothetical protein